MSYITSSLTRKIWSAADNIIFIYVGSAADFALNPHTDWLFYTNRLPSHPQKRFIETFSFNQRLFFSPDREVPKIAKKIREIHEKVEKARSIKERRPMKIPNVGFIQVGDMLIDYGLRGYEYIHNTKLSYQMKEAYFQDMKHIFELMDIKNLDHTYNDFVKRRFASIKNDLIPNAYTSKLYSAFRRDLGWLGFWLFRQFQAYFVQPTIALRCKLSKNPLFGVAYWLYPRLRKLKIFKLSLLLLKSQTRKAIRDMESYAGSTLPSEERSPII